MATERRAVRRRCNVALIVCTGLALFTTPASAQELPAEIQLDRLMVQADRQIRNEQYAAALRTLGLVLELQEAHDLDLPELFWMKRGEVAMGAEDFVEAIASATRYLEITGRAGEQYRAALELLDRAVEEGCAAERMTETLESVRTCLALGADPNAADASGRSALDWAAERRNAAVEAALIAGDSAVAAPGQTAIHLRPHVGGMAGPKCVDWNTQKFFEVATVADVTRCLEDGADVGALTELYESEHPYEDYIEFPADWSPIDLALMFGTSDVVKVLLDAGADPSRILSGHWRGPEDDGPYDHKFINLTPLHLAAALGSARKVRALLDAGADVHVRDWLDWTPLHGAAISGSIGVVNLLLDAGAEVNTSTEAMPSALWLAARFGNGEVFETLVDAGADINYVRTDDAHAIDFCRPQLCPEWIEFHGVHGHEMIFIAAAGDCARCIQLLVKAEVDVDGWMPGRSILVGVSGLEFFATPLHDAAEAGAASAIEALLDLGANVTYRQMWSNDGLQDPTAWALARRRGQSDPGFKASNAYRRLRQVSR